MAHVNSALEASLLEGIRGEGDPLILSKAQLEESKKSLDALLEGSEFEDKIFKEQAEAAKNSHTNITF